MRRAERMRSEMELAKSRRQIVSMLRRTISGPNVALGNVLEVVADAGLFHPGDGMRGVVLVGTAAFQCYSAMLGVILPQASLMITDDDLATAHLALGGEAVEPDQDQDHQIAPRRGRPAVRPTMEAILRRADPTFSGVLQLNTRDPPSKFRASNGFMVDVLAPTRSRADRNPMPVPALCAGAVPLQYLDWLIADAVPTAVLWGAGLLATVPEPARYAVHKLIIAGVRAASSGKRDKDMAQAQSLLSVLNARDPDRLAELLADARSRGKTWASAIDRSLAALERRSAGTIA
jgi:hypothetical protein